MPDSDSKMTARVKRLIELSEKATDGPWEAKIWLEDRPINHRDTSMVVCGDEAIADVWGGDRNGANASFIAAACNDAPEIARALAEAMDAISYIKRERLGDDLPDCAERLLRAWNAKEEDNAG